MSPALKELAVCHEIIREFEAVVHSPKEVTGQDWWSLAINMRNAAKRGLTAWSGSDEAMQLRITADYLEGLGNETATGLSVELRKIAD